MTAEPEEEELGLADPRVFLPLPVFADLREPSLACGVCHDAGAGSAEGGGPPPGAT